MPYPQRAIRTHDFLYIVNFRPDRWPLGDPYRLDGDNPPSAEELTEETFCTFPDDDAGPTKAWLVTMRNDPHWKPHFELAYGKRPREELYDLKSDPHQVKNVAADPAYARHARGARTAAARRVEADGRPASRRRRPILRDAPHVRPRRAVVHRPRPSGLMGGWTPPLSSSHDLRISLRVDSSMKHSFLCVALLGIASASLSAAERPNIVVFLVDDMGVMDTSVPFLTDEAGRPEALSAQRLLSHAQHGAAGRPGDPLQPVLRDERLLADADRDHDRPECGAASHHELDQSRQGQWRPARPAGVELEGIEEGQRHAGSPAAGRRLSHDPRRQGALRPAGFRRRGAAEPGLRRERGGGLDRRAGQLLRHGQLRQRRRRDPEDLPERRAAPGEVPRHRHVPHRGPHDRGERARLRGREGRAAVLPVLRPVCRPCPVQLRPAVRRALCELRQVAPGAGVRHADRGDGQVAGRPARSSGIARGRREHADLLPGRQRLRRSAGP